MQMQPEAVSGVSETTRQEADIRARWAWVEACVWTDRMLAALEDGVTGGQWYSLMDKVYALTTLEAAWKRVERNGGSHGVDRMGVERFAQHPQRYLGELHEALKRGTSRPQPVRRVYIPKGASGSRPPGIPAGKDRVVQAALKMVLEPIFEREFAEHSYGFRPKRGCKDALRAVDESLKAGLVWVVEVDLKSYFDTLPHARLMEEVQARVSDGKVLELIERYLRQEVMDGLERWTPTAGTPQGAVLSPLLANIYLHPLDREMERVGYRMARDADDFVVLCRSEEKARDALARVCGWIEAHGLTLHPEKTQVGNCLGPGQGFDFLGSRFERGRRYVRKKSLTALKDKVRLLTRRTRGESLSRIVADLNPILKGWFNYFKHAHGSVFPPLDSFVRRRLRGILCKQHKQPNCFNRSKSVHQRWPNAFFAELGLFTLKEAWRRASQPR